MDILIRQQGVLFYYPEAAVLARMDNSRSGEWAGPTTFELWDSHFSGLSKVCDLFYRDNIEMYRAFMSPITKVISRGVDDYLKIASQDGYFEYALEFIRKLNIRN